MADEATLDVDDIIEKADEDFQSGDYASASAGWETAFGSAEAESDPRLKRDLAWNIGLSEAVQNHVQRSQWYFAASGYERDHFQQMGLDEVYVQIMLAGEDAGQTS
jgi:hypothetical protein